MLVRTLNLRKLTIGANATYMGQFKEIRHYTRPIDINFNNVEYHLAEYVDYTSPTSNLVHEPILLNGATSHSVVEGAVYTFYGESVLTESENKAYVYGVYGLYKYFPIKSNTQYRITKNVSAGGMYYLFLDSSATPISSEVDGNGLTNLITTPSNASYLGIRMQGDYNFDNTQFRCNEGSVDLGYTPYFEPYYRHKGVRNEISESLDNLTIKSLTLNLPSGYYTLKLFDRVIKSNPNNRADSEVIGLRIVHSDDSVEYGYLGITTRYGDVDVISRFFNGIKTLTIYSNNVDHTNSTDFVVNIKMSITKGQDEPTQYIPQDNNYYIAMGNTLYNIGTSPLIEGNTYSTNGVGKQSRATYTFNGTTDGWTLYSQNSTKSLFKKDFSSLGILNVSTSTTPNLKLPNFTPIYASATWVSGQISLLQSCVFVIVENDVSLETFITRMNGKSIEYDLATATTSVGQAYECDSNLVEGQNLWNEQWEVGNLDNNGATTTQSDRIRSKDFTSAKPNTTYYKCLPTNIMMKVFFYNSSKSFISIQDYGVYTTFITPQNCAYFKFVMAGAYGTTYNNDIAIYEGSTARAYTPHIADEVATHYLHCDKVEQVRVKGQNLFSSSWVNGKLNSSGVEEASSVQTRTDFIEVDSDTQYRIISNYNNYSVLCYYDSNKNYISMINSGLYFNNGSPQNYHNPFTTPSNCKYIRLNTPSNATSYQWDMRKASESTFDTPYAPYYQAQTTPNAYLPSGEVQNNLHSSDYQVVEAWTLNFVGGLFNGANGYYVTLSDILPPNTNNDIVDIKCTLFDSVSYNTLYNQNSNFKIIACDTTKRLVIRHDTPNNTLFKQFLQANNVLIAFKKADTSTTQTITTPSTKTMQSPQQVEIVGKQLSVKVARQL